MIETIEITLVVLSFAALFLANSIVLAHTVFLNKSIQNSADKLDDLLRYYKDEATK